MRKRIQGERGGCASATQGASQPVTHRNLEMWPPCWRKHDFDAELGELIVVESALGAPGGAFHVREAQNPSEWDFIRGPGRLRETIK